MTVRYEPHRYPEEQKIVDHFIKTSMEKAKAMKMDHVTRELSLFVLMEMFSYIVETLDFHGVKGRDFIQDLYYQFDSYEEHGIPPQPQDLMLVPMGDEELEKNVHDPEPDRDMIILLKKHLCGLPEPRVDIGLGEWRIERNDMLMTVFAKAAAQTKQNEKGFLSNFGSSEDVAMKRTPLMKQYLFPNGQLHGYLKERTETASKKINASQLTEAMSNPKYVLYLLVASAITSPIICTAPIDQEPDIKVLVVVPPKAKDTVQAPLWYDMISKTPAPKQN